MLGVARKHPQSAYAGLYESLQQECAFMQRVTTDIRDAVGPVEQALRDTFIPYLFRGLGEVTPGRGVTRISMKQAGLTFPDTMKTAPENWTASYVITGHLVAALRELEESRMADHSDCLREGRTAVWKRSVLRAEEALVGTLAGGLVQGAH